MLIDYDAGGRKLRKTINDLEDAENNYVKDYLGGVEYKDGELESIAFPEGRVTRKDGEYFYEYFLTDHLGNTRIAFSDKNKDGILQINVETTGNGFGGGGGIYSEVLQESHYYPFGMEMEGPWDERVSLPENDYLYNGKELNEDFGLDWLDYGFRWYDPSIARFPNVDPIIERFAYLTPYNYASNDPIKNIDLWGLQGYNVTPAHARQQWVDKGYTDKDLEGYDRANSIAEAMSIETVTDEFLGVGEIRALADGDVVGLAMAVLMPGGRKLKQLFDKAKQLKKNKAAGKAFEKKVADGIDNPKAEQVTIEAADGTRTVMDIVDVDKKGKINLTEAKASEGAQLTKKQRKAHPQIGKTGGTIKGKKGEAIGLPAGTKIPPTKVNVVRPKDLND
jgi:RHS repeat-associated protein